MIISLNDPAAPAADQSHGCINTIYFKLRQIHQTRGQTHRWVNMTQLKYGVHPSTRTLLRCIKASVRQITRLLGLSSAADVRCVRRAVYTQNCVTAQITKCRVNIHTHTHALNSDVDTERLTRPLNRSPTHSHTHRRLNTHTQNAATSSDGANAQVHQQNVFTHTVQNLNLSQPRHHGIASGPPTGQLTRNHL